MEKSSDCVGPDNKIIVKLPKEVIPEGEHLPRPNTSYEVTDLTVSAHFSSVFAKESELIPVDVSFVQYSESVMSETVESGEDSSEDTFSDSYTSRQRGSKQTVTESEFSSETEMDDENDLLLAKELIELI